MKKLKNPKIERYDFGNHILEVEEINDPIAGKMWEFWIYRKNCGHKSYVIGLPADQTKAKINPKMWTKKETIDLVVDTLHRDICDYEEELEYLESRWDD